MKKFSELRAKMSPESIARSNELKKVMLAEIQKADELIQKQTSSTSADTKGFKKVP